MVKSNSTAAHTVYLGLGTNLGDRLDNLRQVLHWLASFAPVKAASPVYQTLPWGYVDQPAFLNAVVRSETDLEPLALLHRLKDVEQALGRQPTFRYGPRQIDIDILLFDDLVLETPGLTIPHPRLPERAFVLAPLAALAPELRHPMLHHTMQQMLAALDPADVSGVQLTDLNLMEANP